MSRILVVVGTRPEAIKMAPVVEALGRRAPALETRLALTGQHTDMVRQVLEAFSLEPFWDLEIMRQGQSLYDVLHRALDGLRDVVRSWRPDVLLVQGDTATVFVGSLVAFFEKVKVGHVEAGLRSGDKWAPFPEEVFRRLSDVLADYYFAPTLRARDALLAEGYPAHRIHVTGNTVVDALTTVGRRERPARDSALAGVLARAGDADEDAGTRLVLLTAHRRESFGAPLREALGAVRELVEGDRTLQLLYPVHPNPEVQGPAAEILSGHDRIHLTEPLDYLDLVAALRSAALVLTDSGGIQEEAPTFGAPVLVLREVTERPEGIEAGVAELVGTDRERILERSRAALAREPSQPPPNPYGDGRAGERIADILESDLADTPRTTSDWLP